MYCTYGKYVRTAILVSAASGFHRLCCPRKTTLTQVFCYRPMEELISNRMSHIDFPGPRAILSNWQRLAVAGVWAAAAAAEGPNPSLAKQQRRQRAAKAKHRGTAASTAASFLFNLEWPQSRAALAHRKQFEIKPLTAAAAAATSSSEPRKCGGKKERRK